MFKTINGWTKEKMKAQIRARNNGSKAGYFEADGEFVCAYRGEENNACAVGCFIQDEDFKPEFNGLSLMILTEYEEFSAMPLDYAGLKALQGSHDSAIRVPKGGDMRDVVCNWIDLNVLD